jgi:CheY-like chemotaxis protein
MTAKKIEPIDFLPDFRPQPRFDKVLLIDDSKTDLFINQTILRSLLFAKEIQQETDPKRALEFLRNVDKLSDIPDLLFLDLNMPEMNGFEFLAEFNQLPEFVRNKCKIVVITSSSNKDQRNKALMNKNVIRYIVKPLDAFHLRDFMV